tara:strand:+ start:6366 stop:7244 length:879 start_codon:yes stop_codon:yes gene_type:complete
MSLKKNKAGPSLVLLDIIRGYSIFDTNGKKYYFKHFSLEEMLRFDDFEKIEFEKAKKSGIETEEELIESAIKIDSWSLKQEESIKALKWTIDHSTKALGKMSDEGQKRLFSKQIERDREKLEEITVKRNKICGYSAEALATQKRFFRMSSSSLFYDAKFTKKIKEKEVDPVSTFIFSKFGEFSNRNILLEAIYRTYFFDVFVLQAKNPLSLFKADFLTLTIFQKNLLALAKGLLNKMSNTRIPDAILGDPVKMYDYEEPKDDEGGKVTHGVEDLREKMQQRGGKLKAEDLLS